YLLAAQACEATLFNVIVEVDRLDFAGGMVINQALMRWDRLGDKLVETDSELNDLDFRVWDYALVHSTLYWKINEEDNESLEIFGLNRGEEGSPGPDYSAQAWDEFNAEKIDALFKPGVDPDERQFWPIWQVFIDGSNGQLVNDYGY